MAQAVTWISEIPVMFVCNAIYLFGCTHNPKTAMVFVLPGWYNLCKKFLAELYNILAGVGRN